MGLVDVVDVPEFDAPAMMGEAFFDKGTVLCFFEGDDEAGAVEIVFAAIKRFADKRGEGDVALAQGGDGVVRDRAGFPFAGGGGEAARLGATGVIGLGGEGIEKVFGEARAIVVAGTEEKDGHGKFWIVNYE